MQCSTTVKCITNWSLIGYRALQVLQLLPGNCDALEGLARLWMEVGKGTVAVAYAEKLVQLRGLQDAPSLELLADALK